MLLHTNVFGRYEGPEQVMRRTELLTEINITDNYAPTASATVRVVDAEGAPVAGACVEYKVYNYAEFYSIATQTTDREGCASLIAGCGDALVWASKGDRFGMAKVSFGRQTEATVALDHRQGDAFRTELCIIPPAESGELPP